MRWKSKPGLLAGEARHTYSTPAMTVAIRRVEGKDRWRLFLNGRAVGWVDGDERDARARALRRARSVLIESLNQMGGAEAPCHHCEAPDLHAGLDEKG